MNGSNHLLNNLGGITLAPPVNFGGNSGKIICGLSYDINSCNSPGSWSKYALWFSSKSSVVRTLCPFFNRGIRGSNMYSLSIGRFRGPFPFFAHKVCNAPLPRYRLLKWFVSVLSIAGGAFFLLLHKKAPFSAAARTTTPTLFFRFCCFFFVVVVVVVWEVRVSMLFLKKAALPPPLVLLRAKNDVDVNDDDVEEAAMMMTTTRGNPMNFYLARGRLLRFFWKKNTALSLSLSLSLLALLERDEERDLETERERNNSALLFFNSLSSILCFLLCLLLLSVWWMNSSSLQRNGSIEFLPRELEKTKK